VEAKVAAAVKPPAPIGALAGLRVIEFAGLGPGPFASMLLADMGAEVVTVMRQEQKPSSTGALMRGRRQVVANLKDPTTVGKVRDLVDRADVLVEGYRPGVMERLGFAPEELMRRNKRLIYARMTGWGQFGPLAHSAGHDINYIAITGALHAIGGGNRPVPPLNLVGDYGGGALYLVVGILAALFERQRSGRGQIIDAAMCDGAASLMSAFFDLFHAGHWKDDRQSNLVDGGAHFYGVYECADGKFISVGAIEPQFYAQLRKLAGLGGEDFDAQMDQASWPTLREEVAAVFRTKSRDEWTAIMAGSDACVAPVLSLTEAPDHPHMIERSTFILQDGVLQPAPAPRFSRTASVARRSIDGTLEDLAQEWSDHAIPMVTHL